MEAGTAPSRTARQRGRSTKAAWLAALAGAALLVPSLAFGRAAAGPETQIGCIEPYNDMETACPAFDGAVDFGVLRDAALPNVYRFEVTAPNTRVQAQLIDVPVDYDLYVTDAAGTELGRSANPGGANESATTTVGPGMYFAYVIVGAEGVNDPNVPYRFELSAVVPSPTPTATPVPTATPQPTAVPARTAPLQVGFQGEFFNTAMRPDSIAKVKDSGAGWVKQQVVWDQYEIDAATCVSLRPYNASTNRTGCVEPVPGRYFKGDQLSFLDAVINDLSGNGLNVMISIVRAPTFIAAPGGHTPADPNRLGDFVGILLNRYKGKVKAIEPWNEQNLSWEWGAGRLWPNAPASPPQGILEFIALQKAAFSAARGADASVKVILPALTPTGLGECWLNEEARSQSFCLEAVKTAIDDRLYLDLLLGANGGEIKNFYDAVGVHPSGYNNSSDDWVDVQSAQSEGGFKGHGSFYIKRYQQLRQVQQKHGDNKPMWFTEVGWTVTRPTVPGYEYGTNNTEDERGRYMAGLLAQLNREAPYVEGLIIWNLNFRQVVGEQDEKYGFGVLNSDGSATPAYTCVQAYLRNASALPGNCSPFPVQQQGIR